MASVGEDVLLFGVSVQIDKHIDPLLVLEDMPLYVKDLFAFLKFRRLPAAIEVVAGEITPRVAENNSIGIDHRNYLYYVLL